MAKKDAIDADLKDAVDSASGMVSLKLTKKEREASMPQPCAPSSDDGPAYPWGSRIRLENETLEKLGIKLPDVGDKLSIEAVGEVIEVSQHESGREKRRTLEIQLTKLKLSKGG